MANGSCNGISIRTFLAAIAVCVTIVVFLGGYIVGGASASGQIAKERDRITELEKNYAVIKSELVHIRRGVEDIRKEQ